MRLDASIFFIQQKKNTMSSYALFPLLPLEDLEYYKVVYFLRYYRCITYFIVKLVLSRERFVDNLMHMRGNSSSYIFCCAIIFC